MRTSYSLILAAFVLLAGTAAHAAGTTPRLSRDGGTCPGNLIRDPGFELGLPNPYWTAGYAVGGYNVLVEDAGSAHGGSWLARMGYPPDSEETGTVSQTVVIPAAGGATLGFWLRLEPDDPLPTDTFYARIDGADLLTVPASSTDYSGAYHYVELDASAFADGGAHEVAFVFEFYGQDDTRVSIDDVCLTIQEPVCPGNLLLDPGFELGLPNPYWTAGYAVGGYNVLVEDAGSAHGGSWLARMGYPPDSEETGTVSQTVVIPAAGGATLGFWLRLEPDDPLPTDTFYARIDGADLLTVPASSTDYSGAYHYVELDASAFADGGAHEVAFVFEFHGQDDTRVSIDDVCLTIQEPVCPGNLLLDPGFELGLPNPYWTAGYAVGGYNVLVEDAGSAHGGSWLARMGYPPDSEETGTVSQTVVIPAAGGAMLGFWLRLEPDDPLPTDTFFVRIDGADLLTVPASSTDYSGAYHYVELDASAFADGGAHEVAFVFEFYGQDWTTVSIDDVCLTTVEGEAGTHAADQDGDNRVNLTELLRVIQFFNSGGFHCAENPGDTEDGYVPGAGVNTGCAPHSSDYHPAGPDWKVSLTELLRLIQFFNSGGYHYCPEAGTEDGYCPGSG